MTNGTSFDFNGLESDRGDIQSGRLTVALVNNDNIENAMKESGVGNTNGETWKYIERESRPRGNKSILSGKSRGKMDYYGTSTEVHAATLHIVQDKVGRSVAYNPQDFGNFLWGQGGKRLGFSLGTLKIAAHVNNAVNSPSDNPGTEYHILDSNGDQRAIRNGYYYNVKRQENGNEK